MRKQAAALFETLAGPQDGRNPGAGDDFEGGAQTGNRRGDECQIAVMKRGVRVTRYHDAGRQLDIRQIALIAVQRTKHSGMRGIARP